MRRKMWAFTLIELLLVMVILAVLAAIVVPTATNHQRRAKERATVAQIALIKGALSQFDLDNSRLPSTEEGLEALVTAPPSLATTWKGPYLEQLPADGWNQPFIYRMAAEAGAPYVLVSIGPDGAEGTEDDIDRFARR
jgi:general secretion pathway protein G